MRRTRLDARPRGLSGGVPSGELDDFAQYIDLNGSELSLLNSVRVVTISGATGPVTAADRSRELHDRTLHAIQPRGIAGWRLGSHLRSSRRRRVGCVTARSPCRLSNIASVSTGKVEYALKAGALHAINYRNEDVAARVREISDGGVKLSLNLIGGTTIQQEVSCLAPLGQVINFGFLGGLPEGTLAGRISPVALAFASPISTPISARIQPPFSRISSTSSALRIFRTAWPRWAPWSLRRALSAVERIETRRAQCPGAA
jgi:hypothetical protein